MSDHRGARLALDAVPRAATLIADRGHASRWFREALTAKGIAPCSPSSKSRKVACPYDKTLHRERHRVEVMFGRLKDRRRVAPATTDAPTRS